MGVQGACVRLPVFFLQWETSGAGSPCVSLSTSQLQLVRAAGLNYDDASSHTASPPLHAVLAFVWARVLLLESMRAGHLGKRGFIWLILQISRRLP